MAFDAAYSQGDLFDADYCAVRLLVAAGGWCARGCCASNGGNTFRLCATTVSFRDSTARLGGDEGLAIAWAIKNGFRRIKGVTRKSNKAMLRLNRSCGFRVVRTIAILLRSDEAGVEMELNCQGVKSYCPAPSSAPPASGRTGIVGIISMR